MRTPSRSWWPQFADTQQILWFSPDPQNPKNGNIQRGGRKRKTNTATKTNPLSATNRPQTTTPSKEASVQEYRSSCKHKVKGTAAAIATETNLTATSAELARTIKTRSKHEQGPPSNRATGRRKTNQEQGVATTTARVESARNTRKYVRKSK